MIVPIMLAWLEADSLASRPALAPETTAVGLRQPLPRWALGDSVFVLPEVRVPGERPKSESRRRAPTGFVTDLVPAKHTRALATVADVLQQAAGVHVIQYGGLGSFSTVSLRGSPANQVALYLDGTPLTSPAHGTVNLADLPATAVERIEVYRGAGPFGFGTGPGGAINVVTLSATTRAEVRSARGAWDTWEGRASLSGSRGPLAGMFHAGYQSSRGDFFYPDDNGTPFNPGDDSLSRRLNNRFDGASAIAALTWRPRAQLQIGVREHLFQKAQGVPGLGAVPARHPRLVVQRSLTQVDLTRSASGRWPSVRLEGALTRERTRFRDREAELGLGRHETDDRVIGDGLGLEVEWPRLPARLALRFAADLRADQARLGDQADGYPDPPHSRRRTNAAAIGLEWRPVDQVVATAARRWERLSDHLRSTGVAGTTPQTDRDLEIQTPQLGLALRGPLGVEVRTNWNRAERAPDFLELFGNQGGVLGNPALAPERIESWDAGAAWTAPAAWPLTGAVEWAHFHSYARDLVLYVRSSQSSVRAQNITRARIHGDELSVRAVAPAGLSLAGALTWQTAVDAGTVPFWTGKRLPQRPGRESTVRLEWQRGPLHSSATLHELGDNYLDRYNRQRVTSRTLVGASLAVTPFLGGFGVVLEAKNLGNRQVSDVAGFPLPGRSLSVACEWRLGPPDPVHP